MARDARSMVLPSCHLLGWCCNTIVPGRLVQVISATVFFVALFHSLQVQVYAGVRNGQDERPNIIFIMADDK